MDEPITLACKRCGWQWEPRFRKVPRACPRCKSYEWQHPRKHEQRERWLVEAEAEKERKP